MFQENLSYITAHTDYIKALSVKKKIYCINDYRNLKKAWKGCIGSFLSYR